MKHPIDPCRESNLSSSLLIFIEDTKAGKYTAEKPEIEKITYDRLMIQEQDESAQIDDDGAILFGISY